MRTIQRWSRNGVLHAVKVPGSNLWLYNQAEVEELLESRNN